MSKIFFALLSLTILSFPAYAHAKCETVADSKGELMRVISDPKFDAFAMDAEVLGEDTKDPRVLKVSGLLEKFERATETNNAAEACTSILAIKKELNIEGDGSLTLDKSVCTDKSIHDRMIILMTSSKGEAISNNARTPEGERVAKEFGDRFMEMSNAHSSGDLKKACEILSALENDINNEQ